MMVKSAQGQARGVRGVASRARRVMAVATRSRPEVAVERLGVRAFTVPTDARESDGTMEWESTTLVLVELEARWSTRLGLHLRRRVDAHGWSSRCSRTSPSERMSCGRRRHGRRCPRRLRNAGRPGAGHDGTSPRSTSRSGTCRRGCSACRSRGSSAVRASPCGCTAPAASAATRSSASRPRCGAGSTRASRRSSSRPRDTPARTRRDSMPCARRSATRWRCSPTRTARSPASRRCAGPSAWPREWGVSWFEEPVQLGRPRGALAAAAPRAGRHGHRRRRVRLPAARLPRAARAPLRRLPAGGRDPLRRLHRPRCA